MKKVNEKLVDTILDQAEERRIRLGLQEVVEVEKVHSDVHSFLNMVESHGASNTIINHENF